jgi:two-component system LytT family sensor kinase
MWHQRYAAHAVRRSLRLLPALNTQAQAHLLANTLSVAALLLRRRPRAAEDLLSFVAGCLRAQLQPVPPLVRLADELHTVLMLVGVERARLGSRLRLEIACPHEVMAALIPPLTVHALVENAIRHGVARRASGGCVRIAARLRGGRLILTVGDNGPGVHRSAGRPGWGLTGVRLRLDALWGPAARLRLLSRAGGTLAVISLPAVVTDVRP